MSLLQLDNAPSWMEAESGGTSKPFNAALVLSLVFHFSLGLGLYGVLQESFKPIAEKDPPALEIRLLSPSLSTPELPQVPSVTETLLESALDEEALPSPMQDRVEQSARLDSAVSDIPPPLADAGLGEGGEPLPEEGELTIINPAALQDKLLAVMDDFEGQYSYQWQMDCYLEKRQAAKPDCQSQRESVGTASEALALNREIWDETFNSAARKAEAIREQSGKLRHLKAVLTDNQALVEVVEDQAYMARESLEYLGDNFNYNIQDFILISQRMDPNANFVSLCVFQARCETGPNKRVFKWTGHERPPLKQVENTGQEDEQDVFNLRSRLYFTRPSTSQ